MIEVKTKLRRWGNSFGVIVPMGAIEKEKINEGHEVVILMKRDKENVLREMFGKIKFGKPTRQLLKEVRGDFESKWTKSA